MSDLGTCSLSLLWCVPLVSLVGAGYWLWGYTTHLSPNLVCFAISLLLEFEYMFGTRVFAEVYFCWEALYITRFERPCIYCIGLVLGVSLTEAARNGLCFVPYLLLYLSACGPLAC